MIIKVRDYAKYKAVTFDFGDTKIETGLIDEQQSKELAMSFAVAIRDLLPRGSWNGLQGTHWEHEIREALGLPEGGAA